MAQTAQNVAQKHVPCGARAPGLNRTEQRRCLVPFLEDGSPRSNASLSRNYFQEPEMSWRVMLYRCCGSRAVPFPSARARKSRAWEVASVHKCRGLNPEDSVPLRQPSPDSSFRPQG